MRNFDYISDEELRQLAIESIMREEAEKYKDAPVYEQPYLQLPLPTPPEPNNTQEDKPEGSRVIIIEL